MVQAARRNVTILMSPELILGSRRTTGKLHFLMAQTLEKKLWFLQRSTPKDPHQFLTHKRPRATTLNRYRQDGLGPSNPARAGLTQMIDPWLPQSRRSKLSLRTRKLPPIRYTLAAHCY
ncbi:hypothetical protein ETB97_001658 [Aspergillus alliaceus]|uniref:Uncharacterized protein n=1 Tax=Petromyces alliaceus TaxID=209559 RepID=A0A8H6E5N9_PETAA|nr:hypothetical protein ETB97_001658 [Aspergillus burnettii]